MENTRPIEQLVAVERAAARVLAESDDIGQAAPRIVRAVCETLGWLCGSRWRLDEASGELVPAEAWGVETARVQEFLGAARAAGRELRAPGGAVRRAWQEGRPVWVADLGREESSPWARDAARAGLHGAFAFPVQAGGEVIGAMEFLGGERERPDADLLECAVHIGGLIGQFLRRKESERELSQLRMAMDASPDLVFVVDPVELRYRYVNDMACRARGISREEHMRIPPWEPAGVTREELRATYDTLIAKPGVTHTTEVRYMNLVEGRREAWFEVQRRALRVGERWLIVTNARDITERQLTQQTAVRRGRMFAALSGTNEAIARARSPEELYQQVCDAAVNAGGVLTATVMVADPQSRMMRAAAVGGGGKRLMRAAPIMIDEASPFGRGLVGSAFRSGQPCVSNDFLNDERGAPWRATSEKGGIRSAGAVPFGAGGRTVGVLLLFAGETGAFDDEAVKLLERLAQNIGLALDNFAREADRRAAEAAMRESEERFRSLIRLSSDWYWEQDADLRFTKFDAKGPDGATIPLNDVLGMRPWELPGIELSSMDWDAHRACLERHEPFRDIEHSYLYKGGKRRYVSVNGMPVFDEAGEFRGYRGMSRDISGRKSAEERIQYLATHDGLTGLPNRTMFNELLARELQAARRYGRRPAVLFVDLDRFKIVNDTLGHAAGDALLNEMAGRLKAALRSSDVIARLGGDEFVVLLQEAGEATQAAAAARKILSVLPTPAQIAGQECRVTASIGVAMYPADGEDGETLMKNADVAMYLAKEAGKNTFQFYSAEIQSRAVAKLAIETRLRGALERGELGLHYQATLDLRTEEITGVEALMRWTSPELGAVSPMQFIPLAEETGLIVTLGKWALREACSQNVAWQREGLPPVRMAVNLSARQFADPDLVADVAEVLRATGMAPELLQLEITESMVMHDTKRAVSVLGEIKALGVRLAIDDFGTGYSSLAQLKRFPIDTIKVDRSFIRDIPGNAEDKAITEAIIAMGRSLRLTVIAEGVETAQQKAFLREHACDEMQGYHFSKPVPAANFAALLRSHRPRRAESGTEYGSLRRIVLR